MNPRFYLIPVFAFVLCTHLNPLSAAFTIHNGMFVNVAEVPTTSAQGHYLAGAKAIEKCEWQDAILNFSIIVVNFSNTPYGQDAYYYLGASYYFFEEYDLANEALTEYLKVQSNPCFFQETIQYKFAIANKLASGAKRRFFGTKQLPKLACGKSMALDVYDEVIAAVPCHEIAAQALIAKGILLWESQDYPKAVESFQLVIRRFPKYELAPDCYLYISKIYLEQSRLEFQNSDILAFAQINLRRFERDYPREERLCEVQQDVLAVKEIYASGLYKTGQFYERVHKPRAAVIYYYETIHQFPETCIAEQAKERLRCLDSRYVEACLELIVEKDVPAQQEESVEDGVDQDADAEFDDEANVSMESTIESQ